MEGRRIVRLGYVLQEYERIIRHSDTCTMGKMVLAKETRFGMNSRLHFFCDNCEKRAVICTDPHQEGEILSEAVVWGNLSIGIGRSQCEELFSLMDIPLMAEKTYNRNVFQVKKVRNIIIISYLNLKRYLFLDLGKTYVPTDAKGRGGRKEDCN